MRKNIVPLALLLLAYPLLFSVIHFAWMSNQYDDYTILGPWETTIANAFQQFAELLIRFAPGVVLFGLALVVFQRIKHTFLQAGLKFILLLVCLFVSYQAMQACFNDFQLMRPNIDFYFIFFLSAIAVLIFPRIRNGLLWNKIIQ